MRTAPGDTANSWDEFYAHWVHPVLHFGTPMLIAFAVLMTLAVMATPLLVGIETPGVRFAGNEGAVRGAYWLGVLCLLFSAIEATVVFPLSRSVGSARHAPWTAGVSIGLVTAALIAGFGLAMVAGRPLSANRKRLWIWGGIFLGLVTAVFVVGLAGPSLGSVHWYFAWLSRKPSSVVYAPLLAAGGIYIVAVTRGIGMGLLIQGHDKKGADDAGLGAFVRARLYSLGSQEPRGILVTQQTDTSTLPSGALGLIPAGTLAKLATLFVSLFTPPTPWRVDVTEQNDGSIVVSMRRNGRVAKAMVIRASTLELPSKQAHRGNGDAGAGGIIPAAGADPSGGDPGDSGTGGDWATELRTAAATFVLVALSRRYEHLNAGLCGASDWRSVALQVIASDSECRLSAKDRHAALVRAVADDRGNKAAELALLNYRYRTAASKDDLRDFAAKLDKLLTNLPEDNEGTLPLRLRSCFNMIVARVNYAVLLTREQSDDAALRSEACDALQDAKKWVVYLLGFWSKPEMRDKYTDLWQSMDAAVNFAAKAIAAELHRTCGDCAAAGIEYVAEESGLRPGVNMTLLARYENACALTRGSKKRGAEKAAEYEAALDELEIAVADPAALVWARRDPSLAELHDVDVVGQACRTAGETAEEKAATAAKAFEIVSRFKGLVGDPVPAGFLSLSPFASYREALALRGIHNPARLRQTRGRELRSELGITRGEVGRWRDLADLYDMADNCRPPGRNGATGAVFLLLQAERDSLAAVRDALKPPANLDDKPSLHDELLGCARDFAVVAPGEAEIAAWGRHLGVP